MGTEWFETASTLIASKVLTVNFYCPAVLGFFLVDNRNPDGAFADP